MIKKEKIILIFLLAILLAPRILMYFLAGNGILSTDAEFRYFPQVEEFFSSFSSIFHHTGPLYTLFLSGFKLLGIDLVAGPVFVQHVLGIVSAFLAFSLLRKINLKVALVSVVFVFSNPLSLWLEHAVLRESLILFFFILMMIFLLKPKRGWLAGIFGLAVVSLRLEFLVAFLAIPLFIFLLKRKLDLSYYSFFIVLSVFILIFPFKPVGNYHSFFYIAYYTLEEKDFYYQDSEYPELLEEYQGVLEKNNGRIDRSMASFQELAERYGREKYNLSTFSLMDKIFFEVILKNTRNYFVSFAKNFVRFFVGFDEMGSLISKEEILGFLSVNSIMRKAGMAIRFFSISLALLFLSSIAFISFKKLWPLVPKEIILFLFIFLTHLLVLSFLSNPMHRFRYFMDPFSYFSEFYLIWFSARAYLKGG